MPHVSSDILEQKISKNIYERFIKTVVGLSSKKDGEIFLSELLTPTEQVMLAKRLAIIFMIVQGVSSYKISKILKISSSTAFRIQAAIQNKNYSYIVSSFKKKNNKEIFWIELEALIRFGMPSMGKDRWNWLDELYKNKDDFK